MARPTTLPGLLGVLAAKLGVATVAERLGTNPRTLHNWAHNVSPMPAIEAARVADLCTQEGVVPIVYQHPGLANGYVGSTPEGWVMWVWGLPPAGYAQRTRYRGHLEGLVGPSAEIDCLARTHGWPY